MQTEARINWKTKKGIWSYGTKTGNKEAWKQNWMLHKNPNKSSSDSPAKLKTNPQRCSVNFPSRQPKSNVVLVFWIKMKKKLFSLFYIFRRTVWFFQTLHIFCCFVYSVFLTRKSLKTKNYSKAHIKQNGFSVEFFYHICRNVFNENDVFGIDEILACSFIGNSLKHFLVLDWFLF